MLLEAEALAVRAQRLSQRRPFRKLACRLFNVPQTSILLMVDKAEAHLAAREA